MNKKKSFVHIQSKTSARSKEDEAIKIRPESQILKTVYRKT